MFPRAGELVAWLLAFGVSWFLLGTGPAFPVAPVTFLVCFKGQEGFYVVEMPLTNQRRGSCGHTMGISDDHLSCATCRCRSGDCSNSRDTPCKICELWDDDQWKTFSQSLTFASRRKSAHKQAARYFEQLKESDQGWQLCATALSSGAYSNNDHVKFFCFQVIEYYLKTKYFTAGPEVQQTVKSFLLSWLQQQSCSPVKEKTFVLNKAAQIFSLACIADYPARWTSFFTDLIQGLNLGETAVEVYLRILMAVDSEVVDREIGHSPQETERNTMIKDTMRHQCVAQMVDSWYQIISTYERTNPELVCLCLEVIGAYVSWIDINLIANDRFVPVLLRFLSMPLLRESTCDCIHETISKGMDPLAKTKLIESFTSVLDSAGLLNISQDEEGDYLAKLAKLVNGIGLQLIQAWQKLAKSKDSNDAHIPLGALETKVPLMFKFLSNEDDDVSGTVTQFAHDYVTVLKQTSLGERQKQHVKEMLYVITEKMKYDDSYSFESEGEEEAMFLEYRKELKVILNNLGALDSQLVVSYAHSVMTTTLQRWQTAEYQDVEVAITLLYMLAEALPASHGQHFSGDPSKQTGLQEMMRQLVSSRVSCYNHPAVRLQFFETVVRYDKFFSIEPQHITDVLIAFLDERGLRNPSDHVRSRTAYLFSRFVKGIGKSHIQVYLEEVLTRVQDLLVLNTPDNGLKHQLSGNDQLFLYETAGILIVQSQFAPQKKQELMRQLLAPIVSKFDSLLQQMVAETDEAKQAAYAECLSQAMAFASRASKGFSNQQTVKQSGCVDAYTETLKVFVHSLDAPVQRQQLQAGVRQFLHRMVVCLDAEILPFVPVAMEKLLKNADAKELHDFIPLINQVVTKFKKSIVPFLQEVFMPIVTTIFRVLSVPSDERDQVAATDRKLLQRSYFSFLATLVNNNVTEVLSNQEMQNLREVLMTLVQGAVDIPDPTAQKGCFSILRRLVEVWGGKDGLPGFQDFVYESIVPACFMAPTKPTFDLADAQTVLALNEAGSCLQMVVEKRGEEALGYLQRDYLPTLNLSPEITQEFCQALKADPKVFRSYFKAFFVRAKS